MNFKISQFVPIDYATGATCDNPNIAKSDVLPIVNLRKTKKISAEDISSYIVGSPAAFSFIPAKTNDPLGLTNPNGSAVVLDSVDLVNPTRNSTFSYYSPNRTVIVPPPCIVGDKIVHACLVKFKVYGELRRGNGTVRVQARRKAADGWPANNLFLCEAEAAGYDGYVGSTAPAGQYPIYESSTEIVYLDTTATDLRFQWRFIDPSTTPLLAGPVVYKVTAYLIGYFVADPNALSPIVPPGPPPTPVPTPTPTGGPTPTPTIHGGPTPTLTPTPGPTAPPGYNCFVAINDNYRITRIIDGTAICPLPLPVPLTPLQDVIVSIVGGIQIQTIDGTNDVYTII